MGQLSGGFSGKYSALKNVPELPEGMSTAYIASNFNDNAAFHERVDLEQSLNAWNYNDGFIDIFWDENKVSSSTNASITTGSNGKVELEVAAIIQEVDGFEDGDFTSNPSWSDNTSSNVTSSVQTGTVKNGSYALEMTGNGSASGRHFVTHDRGGSDSISDGDKYRAWVYTEDEPSRIILANQEPTDTSGVNLTDKISIVVTTYNGTIDVDTSSENKTIYSDTASGLKDKWLLLEAEINPSTSEVVARVFDSNMNQLGTDTTATTSGATNLQYVAVGIRAFNNSGERTFFDDVSYSATSTTITSYASSGSVTHTRKDLGFTPTKIVANPDYDASDAGESINLEVSDNSGNSVTIQEADFETEVSVSFQDGNIQVTDNLSGDGSSTPELNKVKVYAV